MRTVSSSFSKNVLIFLVLLFCSSVFLSFQHYKFATQKRVLKADLVELLDIKYGFFNVDVWKEKITEIISKKVDEFHLSEENKAYSKEKVRTFLYKAIEDFEKTYKKDNEKKALLGISFQNIGADFFEVFSKLKSQVPQITDDIFAFIENKENAGSIKDFFNLRLNEYADKTFQKMDYGYFNSILKKYNTKNVEEGVEVIKKSINRLEKQLFITKILFLLLFLLLLIIVLKTSQLSVISTIVLLAIVIQFLLLGILLPMIDIDARIANVNFQLLGENINFSDQVLYFKSKSILEMTLLMLSQQELKIKSVGIIIFLFSVLLPLLKVTFTAITYAKRELINNKVIAFITLKSGKWSMADVMIVAIFMTYIGFDGILNSQLNELKNISSKVSMLTTNQSDLQSGFFFFLGFVLLSILISQKFFKLQKEIK